MASDKDTLSDEKQAFELAFEAEAENRKIALDDLKFSRLGEQWPEEIKQQRLREGRPVLTINKTAAFIRQVVNDTRQNRPQIKVKPVDDTGDKDTANVFEGLIRNIERTSKADVAYDTGVESAVSMGWGYIRVDIDYEYDDSFDKCLKIERVANPFSVYGDPYATSIDGSDWNRCFVTELLTRDEFQLKYKGADEVDWNNLGYEALKLPWRDSDEILTCESWLREQTEREIYLLSTGQIVGRKEYEAGRDIFEMAGISPVNNRMAKAYKITQRIMTGAEVLETNEWQGQYLPIIPVYGDEINVEGKRYFRSLIHQAKDAQRMFNYWRSTATELAALSPRVPFIGEEGAFDADPRWKTANTESHPYLMYARGTQMPSRQPMDGGNAISAMSEALAASDDMKAIIGMYDASLGQRSNETSGRAIMARQREGDVSTFHFIDNLSRSIRQVGCVLIDLIPKVYNGDRIIRIIGSDETEQTAMIGKPDENGPMPNGAERIYDLSVGRYDVAVDTGPSFTTRREESATQMIELIRSYPQAAPVIGDLMVKALDWPQSDEIAERLKAMVPQQATGGLPPELQQQIDEGQQRLQQLEAENAQLKDKSQLDMAKLQADVENTKMQAELERAKLQLDQYRAQTERMAAIAAQQQTQQEMAIRQQAATPEAAIDPLTPERIVPVIAQTVAAVTAAMPQKSGRTKRTIIRDKDNLVSGMIDEPAEDEE